MTPLARLRRRHARLVGATLAAGALGASVGAWGLATGPAPLAFAGFLLLGAGVASAALAGRVRARFRSERAALGRSLRAR